MTKPRNPVELKAMVSALKWGLLKNLKFPSWEHKKESPQVQRMSQISELQHMRERQPYALDTLNKLTATLNQV